MEFLVSKSNIDIYMLIYIYVVVSSIYLLDIIVKVVFWKNLFLYIFGGKIII